MTSPLESFADRVDPIVRRQSPTAAIALLDVLPKLTALLSSEQVASLTDAVSAVSSPKGSAAFRRAIADLDEIAKAFRDVPAQERLGYLAMRGLDVSRAATAAVEASAKAPKARVPRETTPDATPPEEWT